MKKTASLIVLGIAMSAMGSGQSQGIKDTMHTIYDNLEKAYNKGDLDTVVGYTGKDYNWTMLDGKVLNRDDAKKDIKGQFARTQSGEWHIDIKSLVGIGPVATVVAVYRFKGVMLDDSNHPYNTELSSTERQNWNLSGGAWKLTSDSILETSSKSEGMKSVANVTTPGKPVTPPPASAGGKGY